MTDGKKTVKGKDSKKSKKLRLNKETLKDLSAKDAAIKGGAGTGGTETQKTCAVVGCPT